LVRITGAKPLFSHLNLMVDTGASKGKNKTFFTVKEKQIIHIFPLLSLG
jgi:hypothetical protein